MVESITTFLASDLLIVRLHERQADILGPRYLRANYILRLLKKRKAKEGCLLTARFGIHKSHSEIDKDIAQESEACREAPPSSRCCSAVTAISSSIRQLCRVHDQLVLLLHGCSHYTCFAFGAGGHAELKNKI